MIPTLDYIRLKFDEFNCLCFEGKLKPIPFKLSNSRTFLGQIAYIKKRNPDGSMHYHGFVFRINIKLDLEERMIEDTIIHEMIHYWILSNQWQDTSPHGKLFKAKMNEINRRHNRNVVISHKFTKEEHDSDTEIRQHLVCITRLRNGKQLVTIATRTSLFKLWDEMAKIPDIESQRWVVTTDPYFNRIPRSITRKAYIVPPDELEAHLYGAKDLVRQGNTIRIKK